MPETEASRDIADKHLQVMVDKNSGFCFGVEYAIEMAEDILDEYGELYCLGDIVHNDEEVERLQRKGLKTISHEDLTTLYNTRVLIRAHGEAPETYKLAMDHNIELIDASCPVVLKLQHRVKESFDDKEAPIFIFGKHGHAEVKGLVGQTLGQAVVFQDLSELDGLLLPAKISLFSQTTKDTAKLYHIRDELQKRGVEVDFNDTICRQVSNRAPQLEVFSRQHDVILFVSGTKSSNGKVLYEVCRANNSRTHFISSEQEIQSDWFAADESVGICGATSTPQWLMDKVKSALEA